MLSRRSLLLGAVLGGAVRAGAGVAAEAVSQPNRIVINIAEDVTLVLIYIKEGFSQFLRNENKIKGVDNFYVKVEISRPFFIFETLFTEEQYYALFNPNYLGHLEPVLKKAPRSIGLEGKEIIKHISRITGLRFSYPTSAQWEYACRAGKESLYYNGDDLDKLQDIAWYKVNSNGSKKPVKLLEPNNWGLYDMLGNLPEPCIDYLNDITDYRDPVGFVNEWTGMPRSLHGGGYYSEYYDCYCSSVISVNENTFNRINAGLRLVVNL